MNKSSPKPKKKMTLDMLARMVASGFNDVYKKMDAGFFEIRAEMKEGFNRVDKRFEQIEDRMDGIEERLIRMEHNHGARIEILEEKILKR